MKTPVLLEVIDEHIAVVTLHRPEAANAMSLALLDELNKIIKQVNLDGKIRVVIITADGDKAFCAGADLKERKGMTENQVIEAVTYIGHTINNVEAITVPVIAAINGVAFGGGLELTLACDIRIAAEDTRVGLTETSLAIIPGAGGTQRLPRLIGLGQAKRLIFTAKPITTKEALVISLVEQIVPRELLFQTALEMAQSIAENGPISVKLAKQAINNGIQLTLSEGIKLEHTYYQETIPTKDRLEGLQAFSEKRKPVYQGK